MQMSTTDTYLCQNQIYYTKITTKYTSFSQYLFSTNNTKNFFFSQNFVISHNIRHFLSVKFKNLKIGNANE